MIVINLDKLLTERKMQSLELAKKLGLTVQTISHIKTGKVKAFRLDTMDALCECLGCQPGDILEHVTEDEAARRFGPQFVDEYKAFHHQK